MITIHEENHLGIECRKISESDLKDAEFVTISEFEEQVLSGFYGDWDCTAFWACLDSDGNRYCGKRVDVVTRFGDDERVCDIIGKPTWATHVYWYSK